MARIADTSALYALFDSDDHHHEEAREAFADPEPVRIPSEILLETTNLIEYRFGWETANTALGTLLETPHIGPADPVPIGGVREVFGQAAGELSLADAVVVQSCRLAGADPLAYDDAIAARTG